MTGAEVVERLPDVVLFDLGNSLVELPGVPMTVTFSQSLDSLVSPQTLDGAFESVFATRAPSAAATVAEHVDEWSSIYREVLRVAGYEGDMDAAIEAMWCCWLDCGPLFNDTCDVLSELADRGHRLGVVSNWAPTLDESLRLLGIRDYFEVVVCSALVGSRKPEAKIFQVALDLLDAEPRDCVYVGDDVDVDVTGARAAGIRPILIDRLGAHHRPSGECELHNFRVITLFARCFVRENRRAQCGLDQCPD